jgi:hypothetical protein
VQRRMFFSQMLERVSPAAELAAAFGGITVGVSSHLPPYPPNTPPPTGLAQQAPWIWAWFECWPDPAKNQLVNTCVRFVLLGGGTSRVVCLCAQGHASPPPRALDTFLGVCRRKSIHTPPTSSTAVLLQPKRNGITHCWLSRAQGGE